MSGYDMSKVRGRIVEKYGTQTVFADKIGRTRAFVNNVLNGKSILTQNDIDEWVDVLRIDHEDIYAYFFTKRVHERVL